jgi:hypothetical protein
MAAQQLTFFSYPGFSSLDQIQNDPAFFEISRASGGERQTPGAARHELEAQMAFKPGDLAGYRGPSHAHLLSDRRKTIQFSHPNKELHGLQAIHCCVLRNKYLPIVSYFNSIRQAKVEPS